MTCCATFRNSSNLVQKIAKQASTFHITYASLTRLGHLAAVDLDMHLNVLPAPRQLGLQYNV